MKQETQQSFWNTWMGAFLIVPPAFMLAMWAYYEFIGFASKCWAAYQHYSAMTSMQIDAIVVAFGILSVVAYKRYAKSPVWQALLSVPLVIVWISALWGVVDLIAKTGFIAQYRAAIEHSVGATSQEPSVFDKFSPFWGLPIEAIFVGALAIGSILAICGVAIGAIYVVFFAKKTSSAGNADTPC